MSAEIWLTAAQSFFALSILVNFEISVREAIVLLVLFLSQVGLEFLIIRGMVALPITSHGLLLVYAVVYVLLGATLFVHRRAAFRTLIGRATRTIGAAIRG